MSIGYFIAYLIVMTGAVWGLTSWFRKKLSLVAVAVTTLVAAVCLLGLLISSPDVPLFPAFLLTMYASGALFCAYLLWRKHKRETSE